MRHLSQVVLRGLLVLLVLVGHLPQGGLGDLSFQRRGEGHTHTHARTFAVGATASLQFTAVPHNSLAEAML